MIWACLSRLTVLLYFHRKRAKRSRAVWDTSTSLRARTLRELAKEKQTEKETAGSKTPRITVSLPSRTHSRPQKPPALLAPPTQWKHHRQPSRRLRQRQSQQRREPPTASQLERSSQRDNDKEICSILYLVLFISCTNDCETRWNRFHITSPYLTRYSLGSREKHTSGSEQLCSPQTSHSTLFSARFYSLQWLTKWNEVSLQNCTDTIFIRRFSQTQLNEQFNLVT